MKNLNGGNTMDKSKMTEMFFGPNHPGVPGNYGINYFYEGDTVVSAEPNAGHLHRGFEKLMEEREWIKNTALVCRICVMEPDINEMVYAMGYEAIGEIEVPKRAQYIRSIILEMARIQAHIFSIGGNCGAIGLYTAMHWGVLARDYILDLFEEITGGRVYHIYIRPGGVRHDIEAGTFQKLLDLLDDLEKNRMPEFEKLIFENPTAQKRWKNTAVLNQEDALRLGVTGPTLRATGLEHDVRKLMPYGAYDEVDFEIPTGNNADAWTRMKLKRDEIFQSINIIRQLIKNIPDGPVSVNLGNALKYRIPKGEAYVKVESGRG
jgi:NADH-quinone oxidoreductase subunit D